MATSKSTEEKEFQKKVWTAAGIIALIIVLILIIKTTFNIFLLILAGSLIAIYFHGLAGLIQRKFHLSSTVSLIISIVGSFILLIGFFWFTGNRIQQQISELSETLPAAVENFKQKLNNTPVGQEIIKKATSEKSMSKLSSAAQSFFRSTFGVLGDVYIVLFLGLFFTAAPKLYVNGFLKLIPSKGKDKAESVVGNIGTTLTKWLKGKLFAMLIVAVLTAIGLLILGVPMAFALALIAGILNFIPNFGPIIALIPAVLVGFMQGTTTGLLVGGLYIVVQILESNIITPQIQKRLISIPPALIISAQLFMGVLTGGWGLIIATPLVAILIVVVQDLYIKKQEG